MRTASDGSTCRAGMRGVHGPSSTTRSSPTHCTSGAGAHARRTDGGIARSMRPALIRDATAKRSVTGVSANNGNKVPRGMAHRGRSTRFFERETAAHRLHFWAPPSPRRSAHDVWQMCVGRLHPPCGEADDQCLPIASRHDSRSTLREVPGPVDELPRGRHAALSPLRFDARRLIAAALFHRPPSCCRSRATV